MAAYPDESDDDGGEETASDEGSKYDAFGTPKTRSAMKPVPRTRSAAKIEGKRAGSGKTSRTNSSKAHEPTQALARQSRNMTAARRKSKDRRQKAVQQARFFKEIDTTLEALGIGTAADAAAAAGGAAATAGGTGMPPSPVSSTLSLNLALSSDPQLGTLTPTALSSRAGTPPPGAPAPGGAAGGAGANGGTGSIGRRVTSEMSLRSSDLPSGCSTPDRHLSAVMGGAAVPPVGVRAASGAPGRSSLTGLASEPVSALMPPRILSMAALLGAPAPIPLLGSPAAAAAGLAAPTVGTAVVTAEPFIASAVPAAMAVPQAAGQRRTISMSAVQGSGPHRRSASYEDAAAAAAVATVVATGPYHPTPSRGGWVPAVYGGAADVAAAAAAPQRQGGALDRDLFRRQLGSVLVGHGMTPDELEAGVAEAEERGEGLEAEMEALVAAAEELGGGEEEDAEEAEADRRRGGFASTSKASWPAVRWSELSELVASLDDMYRRVKDVLRKVKPYKSLLAEDPDLLPRLGDLALQLLGALAEAAGALGSAACRGVRGLGLLGGRGRGVLGSSGGEDEVKNCGKLVRRLMETLEHVMARIGDELGGKPNAAAKELLARCKAVTLELSQAGIQAASAAAPVLLTPASLNVNSFAHEKSSQAKRLAALWDEAARQAGRGKRFSRHRLALFGELCEMYGTAGKLALAMTQGAPGLNDRTTGQARRDGGSLDGYDSDGDGAGTSALSEDFDIVAGGNGAWGGGGGAGPGSSYAPSAAGSDGPAALVSVGGGAWGGTGGGGGGGAWGSGARAACGGGGGTASGPSDLEIQAQAWVPALLQVLLNRASDAHRNLRNELANEDVRRERERNSSAAWPEGASGSAAGDADGADAGSSLGLTPSLLGSGGPSGASYGDYGGGGGPPLSDERVEELWCLLDEMQQTFAELCVANLKRTVRLCSGGAREPLPLWALELSRDAAEAGLRFIHTHEHSSMALGDLLEMEGELAGDMQKWLRDTWTAITGLTTDVVNGLLSIRRQINVRRTIQAAPDPTAATAAAAARRRASAGAGATGSAVAGPSTAGVKAPSGRLPPGGGRATGGITTATNRPYGSRAIQTAGVTGKGFQGSGRGRPPLSPSAAGTQPQSGIAAAGRRPTAGDVAGPSAAGPSYGFRTGPAGTATSTAHQVPGSIAAAVAGGTGFGITARTPSQDPDTMAHWYDRAYDDAKGAAVGVPQVRPVAPQVSAPPRLGLVAEAPPSPSSRSNEPRTMTPSVPPTDGSLSSQQPTPSAPPTSKWLAALLSPPPAGAADAVAGGTRPARNSIDASGPGRPAIGAAAANAASPSTADGRGARRTGQHAPPGPTSGSQRIAAAAEMRRKSQSGPGGRGGRGAGGGGNAGRGHGRLFGRGRRRGRPEEDLDGAASDVSSKTTGSAFQEPQGQWEQQAQGGQAQSPFHSQQQQQQQQPLPPVQRRGVSEAGASARDDAASDWSMGSSTAHGAAAGTTAGASPVAAPSGARSYASVARSAGGLTAALAAAGARPTGATASAAPDVPPTSPPPRPSPATLSSPFANTGSSAVARHIPGAPPSPGGFAVPTTLEQPRVPTATAASPFQAAAQQLLPSSTSPSQSPLNSGYQSPHVSAPPSPLRPDGDTTATAAAPPAPSSPPAPALPQPSPPRAVPTQSSNGGFDGAGGAGASSRAPSRGGRGAPADGGVGSPAAGSPGLSTSSGASSFQFSTAARAGPAASATAGPSGAGAGGRSIAQSNGSSGAGGDGGSNPGSGSAGGHMTPRLSSPSGSGPVVMPGGVGATARGGSGGQSPGPSAPASGAPASPPPAIQQQQPKGGSANGHPNHGSQSQQQTGTTVHATASTNTGTTTVRVGGGAGGGGGGGLQLGHRLPSLTTQPSFGLNQGIGRAPSYGLPPGGESMDDFGHHSSADVEPTPVFGDPELAELLRTIARDPFWDIRWADLSNGLSNIVGWGSTGQVYSGMYLHAEVAIKVIGINREMKYDVKALSAFKAEVDLNKRLNNHPNIVRFMGVCAEYIQHAARQAGLLKEDDIRPSAGGAAGSRAPTGPSPSGQPMLAIVMEYCHLGTLYDMIGEAQQAASCPTAPHRRCGLDFYRRWERRLEVLYGAAAGLEYMHRCDVIHHDFTSYNLLLEEKNAKWITKVCDFNLSRVVVAHGAGGGASMTVPNSGRFSSPRWQSPEYLAGEEYGWTTDVFSFAVVIWEVVNLKRPWESEMQGVRFEPIAIHKIYTDGKRLAFPEPEALRPPLPELPQIVELCQACWHQDPRQRPRMDEVAETLLGLLQVVRAREAARREAARRAQAEGQQPHAVAAPPPGPAPAPTPAPGGVAPGPVGGPAGTGPGLPSPGPLVPPAVKQPPVSPFAVGAGGAGGGGGTPPVVAGGSRAPAGVSPFAVHGGGGGGSPSTAVVSPFAVGAGTAQAGDNRGGGGGGGGSTAPVVSPFAAVGAGGAAKPSRVSPFLAAQLE